MNDDLLGIFTGAAEGLEKTSQNLMNIMLAKHEIEQKDKVFKLDYKIKEQQLDQAILKGATEEDVELERKMNKASFTLAGAKIAQEKLLIKKTHQEIQREKDAHEMALKVAGMQMFNPDGSLKPGVTVRSDGSFSMSGGPVRKEQDGSLEDLLSGGGGQETPGADENTSFSPEIEDYIQKAVDHHGKTREEVVQALKDRGAL